MSREEQRRKIRQEREGLIEELEAIYHRSFERLTELDLGEGNYSFESQTCDFSHKYVDINAAYRT